MEREIKDEDAGTLLDMSKITNAAETRPDVEPRACRGLQEEPFGVMPGTCCEFAALVTDP